MNARITVSGTLSLQQHHIEAITLFQAMDRYGEHADYTLSEHVDVSDEGEAFALRVFDAWVNDYKEGLNYPYAFGIEVRIVGGEAQLEYVDGIGSGPLDAYLLVAIAKDIETVHALTIEELDPTSEFNVTKTICSAAGVTQLDSQAWLEQTLIDLETGYVTLDLSVRADTVDKAFEYVQPTQRSALTGTIIRELQLAEDAMDGTPCPVWLYGVELEDSKGRIYRSVRTFLTDDVNQFTKEPDVLDAVRLGRIL